MSRIPAMGEIHISKLEDGGAKARLRTEHGYLVSIEAPANNYESGYFILSEYLDELGYDGEREVEDKAELEIYDSFDGTYKMRRG